MHILLYLAWPVTNIHRIWNNAPVREVNWFLASDQQQDVQWYVYLTGLMLAPVMVLAAVLIFILLDQRSTAQSFLVSISCLLVVGILDIVNYWVWAGHEDSMMFIQCELLMIGGIISYINESNRRPVSHGNATKSTTGYGAAR